MGTHGNPPEDKSQRIELNGDANPSTIPLSSQQAPPPSAPVSNEATAKSTGDGARSGKAKPTKVIRDTPEDPYKKHFRKNALDNLACKFVREEQTKDNKNPTLAQFLAAMERHFIARIVFDPPISEKEWTKTLARAKKKVKKLSRKPEPPSKPKIDSLPIQPTPEREQMWSAVERVFGEKFHQPDIEAVKVVLACVAAHRIPEYPPAWNMAIAVAGSMKTVILESLDGLPDVHLIDEVTPQTFISGKIDTEGHDRKSPASLLHRIGNQGILISADFSTVLTSDPRNRAKVFSQLRRIYDGHLHREFGSDENLEERDWKGRITFLAGVTPEVDRHYKVFAALGDRFLRTRWPRAEGSAAALRAMQQDRRTSLDVKAAIHAFMLPVLSHPEIAPPSFPEALSARLASLSEFVAHARAYVPRDRKDEIDGEAQVESNTRLAQELAQVGRGWAVLMNRSEVREEDFKLIRRVAFDSLPPLRRVVLETIRKGERPHSLGLPASTVDRALGDLQAIGLITLTSRENAIGEVERHTYELTESAKSLLREAGEAFQEK